MVTESQKLLAEKRAICREHMLEIETVIVIPRPIRNTADVYFIWEGDVERFDFGTCEQTPNWITPNKVNQWGYFFKDEKETWQIFIRKIFKFLTGASDQRKILVMKEAQFLKHWNDIVK